MAVFGAAGGDDGLGALGWAEAGRDRVEPGYEFL